jgi:hypothetical protein
MREKGPKAKVSRNRTPDKTLTAEDNDLLTVVLNLLDDSVKARLSGDLPVATRKNKEARAVLKHLIADRVIEKPDTVVPLITEPGGSLNPVKVRVYGEDHDFVSVQMEFRSDEPDFISIRMQKMEAFLREKGIEPPPPKPVSFSSSISANRGLAKSQIIKDIYEKGQQKDFSELEAKVMTYKPTDPVTEEILRQATLMRYPDAAKG